MKSNKNVEYIPPRLPKYTKRVGIYARVSTDSKEQLESFKYQVSHYTRVVATTPFWMLADIYMDISSSKERAVRKEFNRLFEDCKNKKIDIFLAKSVSRFGRNTVEVLEVLNQLKVIGVRVIFDQEDLDTGTIDNDVLLTLVEALAQDENRSRSENIKLALRHRAADGTSKSYYRRCYGYTKDKNGGLQILKDEAKNVRLIFDLYLLGKSVIGIGKELERRGIVSPTGKSQWCKRTIDVMLSNEKYMGNARLMKSSNDGEQYLSEGNNPVIISEETFKAVQIEKKHRSNITMATGVTQRKKTKYSSKK